MKRIICLVLAVMLIAGTSHAATPYGRNQVQVQRVKEKVIQYNEALKVIGIPINQVGAEYYYRQPFTGGISDADAEKIAKAVVRLLSEDPAAIDGDGGDGQGPQVSELEKNFANLVVAKCASCHKTGTAGDSLVFVKDESVQLIDLEGKLSQSSIAWSMYDSTFAERMPKDKPKLSNEEVDIIRDYARFLTKQERENGEQE